MDIAALAVNIVALAVASLIGVQQLRIQNRASQIESDRRAEEIDFKDSAILGVAMDGTRSFIISNTGGGVTHNVEFDAKSVEGGGRPIPTNVETTIPLLRPSQEYTILAAVSFGNSPPYDCTLAWNDDRGNQSETFRVNIA